VVVPSRTLERVARETWRLRAAQVAFVPNGIHLDRFEGPAERDGRPDRPVRIGTVGALRAEKNLPRLLRAVAVVARDHAVELHVVGDGPQRDQLEAETRRLGLGDRVRFHGHVARPETVLATLDIFALASDTEQMPLTLLEAMAAGLPVVATDVGDVRTLVPRDSAAGVVPATDEAAFARALAALVAAPARRRDLGAGNRAHARRHFGLARMVERYDALFGACLGAVRASSS